MKTTIAEYLTDVVIAVLGTECSLSALGRNLKAIHGPTARFQKVEKAGLAGVLVRIGSNVAALTWAQHSKHDARLYLRAFLMARHAASPRVMEFASGQRRVRIFPDNTVVHGAA